MSVLKTFTVIKQEWNELHMIRKVFA